MRTIDLNDIGGKLLNLVLEENPVSEDIGIIDENGELLAVIIPKYLYDFLQEKVEETEDILDREAVEEFHKEQNEKQEADLLTMKKEELEEKKEDLEDKREITMMKLANEGFYIWEKGKGLRKET